jgi:4-amino-4-deoxy-L-arabinose transferase-like glycosyltransferase
VKAESAPAGERRASHVDRELLAVALLAVVPLLPFLDAAVSIDAPVFLAVARQIAVAPLDPFGFDMIWDPVSPHAAFFNHNPPLLSYYLVPWISLFGEWEPALHFALLPFPLVAGLAFAGIARRLAGDALGPAALLVTTPAFLVLASTLLLDVPLLACLLLAIYALLRAREGSPERWQLVAGLAAAAAGLVKYVGFATAPLLAAGVVLFLPAARRAGALLRCVGLPLAVWAAWGAWTGWLYGAVHYAGGLMLVGGKSFDPDEFWNQALSVPIYYGGALIFPVLAGVTAVVRGVRGAELAVAGLLAGGAVVHWVLPGGEPPRRIPLGADQAVVGAFCFAGACFVWGRALRPARVLASVEDRFLALWLAGFGVFSVFVNWHINAADALMAAPPALLLLFRDAAARPGRRAVWLWVAVTLPFSMGLAWADALQGDVYRTVARRIAAEIGDRSGARWCVGHWGFQYYLEREGFAAVVPPQYERSYGRSELSVDDWVASARNVSQLDVSQNLARYEMRRVWQWSEPAPIPLRTTNPDAGAGFYSHHAGYLPFGWSGGPLEQIGLGRVTSARGR